MSPRCRPPRPRLTATALLLVLALGPLAAAANDEPLGDLVVRRLSAADAAVAGALTVYESLDGTGTMALDAAEVEVTVEEERGRAYLVAPMFGSYDAGEPQRATHTDVVSARIVLRPGHQAYVYPLGDGPAPTVAPEPGCASMQPSARDEVRPPVEIKDPQAHARHPSSFATGDAIAWHAGACEPAAWTVTGSFEVRLYEADATFDDAAYTSGYHEEGTGTVPLTDTNVTEERIDRYVFLAVRDGTMRMLGRPAVFLATAHVDAAELALEGASGTLRGVAGGSSRLSGEPVGLAGDLAARVSWTPAGLEVHVTGRLESGSVGGRAITVASPASPARPDAWLLSLVAVPVLAGGGAAAWRGGPAKRLARLTAGLLADPAAVAKRSRRFARHPDLAAEAAALRIDALARAGRHAEALAEAERLEGWEGALAAAYVHALAGDVADAVTALRPWRGAKAPLLGQALRQPAFAAVRHHPEANAWLREGTM